MVRILSKLLIIVVSIFGATAYANETITIGASPVPHAEILRQAIPLLQKEGVDLKITEINDYVTPNLFVNQKQLDANFFQHRPYLAEFNKTHGINLVVLTAVEIEPMAAYVNPKYTKATIKQSLLAKKGLLVGVPNDTTNEGRALQLLEDQKWIQLKHSVKFPTKNDIIANPYNLKFTELDPAMLPRELMSKQLDVALINSNYALEAGLTPLKDAIFVENSNSPYANVIAIRADELNLPKMKKLANVLHSKQIADFILKQYHGAVLPVSK